MTDVIRPFAEWAAGIVEGIGIFIIAATAVYVVLLAAVRLVRRQKPEEVFERTRQRLGRGILLGLEFLVAADIVHTVAIELSFESVGVLAAIVLIRTFLSFTLEVELTGHWPWQNDD